MKKKITASESVYDMHHGAFSELANSFYNEHYELSVDAECNLTAKATEDAQYMPTIEIKTDNQDGKYWYSPKLTFPVLNYDDMEFYDSIAHWTKRWSEIGSLMSQLAQFCYDPAVWEDDEEE